MTIVAVGRPRNKALAAAIDEYEERAGRYWQLSVREVREERGSDRAAVRRGEAARLADAVGSDPFVACEEGGRAFNSDGFAEWLRGERDNARDVTFVLGGAFGLDATLSARARMRLTLAPWTLPHELARVVLSEQLYRAGSILRGEPYHK